ncbi:MAG: PEP-CTERM sorting domain-containing protein [Planctomycetes bacterium]|nr:PEP-CTERM sorting domain-containing protein [Planctomycetota bacterium]
MLSLALALSLVCAGSAPTSSWEWDSAIGLLVAAPQDPAATNQGTVPSVPAGDRRDSPASAVPEPTTLFLVGAGLIGLAVSSRRWRKTISTPSR